MAGKLSFHLDRSPWALSSTPSAREHLQCLAAPCSARSSQPIPASPHLAVGFSLLFFFIFIDRVKPSSSFSPSLCCRWQAGFINPGTSLLFCLHPRIPSSASRLVAVPRRRFAETFAIPSGSTVSFPTPKPPSLSSAADLLQTNAPSCCFGCQGFSLARCRATKLGPRADRWPRLWFRLISSQPRGNGCHGPGLALQPHLLSAEQPSGLESKGLIDLAEALSRNLLRSEMLSYEAKVMEKFS